MKGLRHLLYPATVLFLIGITLSGCFGCSSSSSPDKNSQTEDPTQSVGVNVLSLKDNSAEFEIADNCEDGDGEYFLRVSNDSGFIKEKSAPGNSILQFDGLKKNTIYKASLFDNAETLYDEIVVKTFQDPKENSLELFILTDASFATDQEVGITVFGYNPFNQELHLERRSTQFRDIIPTVIDGNVETNGNVIFTIDEDISAVVKEPGYFRLSYTVDKSYQERRAGYLDEHYLMTTVDQLFLLPHDQIHNHYFQNNDELEINGHLNVPDGWNTDTGFPEKNGLIRFLDTNNTLSLQAAQLFGFNADYFIIQEMEILGTEVIVILENSVDPEVMDIVFDVYELIAWAWGDKPEYNTDDRYSVMLVDDERNIYGGEHDTHQGYSVSHHGKTTPMLSHQIFHRWNGWHRGVDWDWSSPHHRGLWVEGVTEYYAHKVYRELGYSESLEHQYNWYKSIRGTADDIPILDFDGNLQHDGRIIYYKGPLLAYKLDEKIIEHSGGEHSLEDILQYTWEKWQENRQKVNYDKILTYIQNELGLQEVITWWDEHIVGNQPIHIDKFEG